MLIVESVHCVVIRKSVGVKTMISQLGVLAVEMGGP